MKLVPRPSARRAPRRRPRSTRREERHLLAGEPKDEALRAAQMALIAGPITYLNAAGETVTRAFSAPYHWAAFQLVGDWQ